MSSHFTIGLAAVALLTVLAIGPVHIGGPPVRSPVREVRLPPALVGGLRPPAGFVRVAAGPGTWSDWLRSLPLKPQGTPIRLYTGALKPHQDSHAAVIDIDIGNRDLQQCADAVIRLRAEWLWSQRRLGDIAFTYTGGGRVAYARWAQGERPTPDGRVWKPVGAADASYAAFRKYLEHVMSYAGTASLEKELKPVRVEELSIGDVFIKGGFPGHAVLVIDLVHHPVTGENRVLLAQSHMPAQDIHILKNPESPDGSPWYSTGFRELLVTPDWTFQRTALRRWPGA